MGADNGDGLLVSETIDGAETVFTWDLALDVAQVLATSDGTKNLYGLERRRSMAVGGVGRAPWGIGVEQAGAWRYSLPDALGSVRQWTDPAGAVLGVQSYGPFGEPRGPVGTPPWGYTGEWRDPAGMVYLRARWYNPSLGRFSQVDPVVGGLMVPATLHPYAYVLNDPLNDTDPSGEVGLLAALGISVGVGALAGAVGGGVSYAIANPGHSLGEYVRDPGFQRSVASGAVGGAVAGLAIWALPTPTTFLGAVGVGVVSGSLGGGASRVTENLLRAPAGTRACPRRCLSAAPVVGRPQGCSMGRASGCAEVRSSANCRPLRIGLTRPSPGEALWRGR